MDRWWQMDPSGAREFTFISHPRPVGVVYDEVEWDFSADEGPPVLRQRTVVEERYHWYEYDREGLAEAARARAEFDDGVAVGGKRGRVAASSEAIRGLREVKASCAVPQTECAVCLGEFGAEETLRAMPCAHAFHQECIFEWLRRNGVCPLCRHQLPTQQQEDE